MPTQLADNEFLLRCACHSSDHVAMLIHDPVDSSREECDWYLSVFLDYYGFWKRIRIALRYVFCPYSIRYGICAEIVLHTKDIADMEDFIMRRRNPDGEAET